MGSDKSGYGATRYTGNEGSGHESLPVAEGSSALHGEITEHALVVRAGGIELADKVLAEHAHPASVRNHITVVAHWWGYRASASRSGRTTVHASAVLAGGCVGGAA